MTRKSITYSFILHSIIILLAAELHFYDFVADNYSQKKAILRDLENVVRLDLGAIRYIKSEPLESQWSQDSYRPSDIYGVDRLNYGRVVSSILLKKLQSSGVDVGQNKVKIILTIGKNGNLLGFDLHFQNPDPNLQASLEHALNSGLKFPYNEDLKKKSAKYQVFLF